ncbi:MAG: hypothetical protein QNJ97_21580 [Myxococcota bacterium]|nr:hypothetical protein [Myxococcota bacterium]
MSLTSCYKYAVQLPDTTMSRLLRATIAQSETAPVIEAYHETDIPVGDYLVTVHAYLIDDDDHVSSMGFTATDLETVLTLHAHVEVTVQDFDGLNPIVYGVSFQIPGTTGVSAADPPWLEILVGDLDPDDLGISVSGGELDLTPTVFEGPIHEMYAENTDLHIFHEMQLTTEGQKRFTVRTEDTDTNPITVEVPDPATLRVNIPGTMEIWSTDMPAVLEHEATMVITVDIPIVDQEEGGVRTVILDVESVTSGDVSVDLVWSGSAPSYAALIDIFMPGEVATRINGFGNQERELPGAVEVQTRMEVAIADFVSNTTWGLIPLESTGEFPIDEAVPMTINSDTLVLLIEDEPGEPCDTPDSFVGTAMVATGIGHVECQRRLDAACDQVPSLPSPTVSGYSVTLHRPTMSLADPGDHGIDEGHIWVEGTAVVHVGGCVGDVDASYEGGIVLSVSTAPNGDVNFSVEMKGFSGDNEKDKKEDIDPEEVASYLESLDWDFPEIPTEFEGRGIVEIDFNECFIDTRGITIAGDVSVTTINTLLMGTVLPKSAFWANP